eukprot:1625147-Rhodomonas_salina.1
MHPQLDRQHASHPPLPSAPPSAVCSTLIIICCSRYSKASADATLPQPLEIMRPEQPTPLYC